MKPTVRTFIAVEINDSVRRAAAGMVERLREESANASWVAPHNMHLTVKFLGDVTAERIPQICQAVTEAVAGVAPFDLRFRGVGAFPNASRPRTVWLGTEAGQEELASLVDRVEKALKKLGFPREGRAFRGHLTLGRIRKPTPALAALTAMLNEHADFEAGVTSIDGVVVFSSQLSPAGSIYEALARPKFADE